ncbi:MAG: DUF2249 domain-containing protein [Nocardioides sp.]|nr:DUF2249 domain-containing protein [Nocardioides sp.]
MDNLTFASTEADARAVEAVEEHHAVLAGALAVQATALADLARAGRTDEADLARTQLLAWCRDELVPHALAEEGSLYRAAAEQGAARLLVEAMLAQHRAIAGLVDALESARDAVSAAVVGGALRALFDVHLAAENEQILPLLVAAPSVSVAELLGDMHEMIGVGAADHTASHTPGTHEPAAGACGCHEVDPAGWPELDARLVPHKIRHATVFGALDAVAPGASLVLLAPHDPLPLLDQLQRREPDAFSVDYLARGPETWRLLLTRAG